MINYLLNFFLADMTTAFSAQVLIRESLDGIESIEREETKDFANFIQNRGGWISAGTCALALNNVLSGMNPEEALESALDVRYNRKKRAK